MNDKDFNSIGFKSSYGNDYFNDNPEIRTNKNIETLDRLLSEANYGDDVSDSFSLDNQYSDFDGDKLNSSFSSMTSSPAEEDPLERTMDISNVSLPEMKELQAKLHEIYDEPSDEEVNVQEGQNQSKGKSLVKATKQGIAFSNGNMTRTFLDCVVLCFITASMGYGMFMYILTHI